MVQWRINFLTMILSHLIQQKGYEKIEYLLRRHPITFVPDIFLFLILMVVPFIVYLLINNLYPVILDPMTSKILFPIAVLSASIYYMGAYLFFYFQFIEFYLDMWVVTNDRIVDVEQNGLFSRTISELDLYRVQDVTVETNGFFPSIFKYGNVKVKTASQNMGIIFHNVPNPNEIREALIQLSDADRKHHEEA